MTLSNPVLVGHPDRDTNVFLMTRFRETEQHAEIEAVLRQVLEDYGLALLRADYRHHDSLLWSNVQHYMDACSYGVAVFEQIDERDINPNVVLELGYMLGQRKLCLLLKEKRVPALPVDLAGHPFTSFDSYRPLLGTIPVGSESDCDATMVPSQSDRTRIVMFRERKSLAGSPSRA